MIRATMRIPRSTARTTLQYLGYWHGGCETTPQTMRARSPIALSSLLAVVAAGCSDGRNHEKNLAVCQGQLRDYSPAVARAVGALAIDGRRYDGDGMLAPEAGSGHLGAAARPACPAAQDPERIAPILFIPSDLDSARAEQAGERALDALARTQDLFQRQSRVLIGEGRTIDFDRLQIVHGQMPVESYWCSQRCDFEVLSAAVLAELESTTLDSTGMPLVFVVGGGALLAEVTDGTTARAALVGDYVMASTSELCGPGDECESARGGDLAVARLALSLMGAGSPVGGDAVARHVRLGLLSRDAVEDEDSALVLTEDQARTLPAFGALRRGAHRLSQDVELLAAMDTGVDRTMIVWHRATGQVPPPREDGTAAHQDTLVGAQHTQLVARMFGTGGMLGDEIVLSRPPAPTAMARRVDSQARVVYDARRHAFQLLWTRRFEREGQIVHQLMGRRVSRDGALLGDERVLADLGEGPAAIDARYLADRDAFLLAWAGAAPGVGAPGEPLQVAFLDGEGAVLGPPEVLAEGARFPQITLGTTSHLLTFVGQDDASERRSSMLLAQILDANGTSARGVDGQPAAPRVIHRGPADRPTAIFDGRSFRIAYAIDSSLGGKIVHVRGFDGESVGAALEILADARFRFLPAMASRGDGFLVASAAETGEFLDGLGTILMSEVDDAGAQRQLRVHSREEAFSSVLAAELANGDLGVAWSGAGGVHLEIVPAASKRSVDPAVVSMR